MKAHISFGYWSSQPRFWRWGFPRARPHKPHHNTSGRGNFWGFAPRRVPEPGGARAILSPRTRFHAGSAQPPERPSGKWQELGFDGVSMRRRQARPRHRVLKRSPADVAPHEKNIKRDTEWLPNAVRCCCLSGLRDGRARSHCTIGAITSHRSNPNCLLGAPPPLNLFIGERCKRFPHPD